jgi:hypothetical protein
MTAIRSAISSAVRQAMRLPASAGFADGPWPVLNLDMVNSATLDTRITFSRGSGGGAFGSDGLYRWYGYNLLLQSSQFDTTWVATRCTPTESGTSSTGSKRWLITTDGTATTHAIGQVITFATGVPYTFSIEATAGTFGYLVIQLPASAFATAPNAFFNLNTGAAGTVSGGATSTITSLGSGRYRCTITATSTAATTGNNLFYATDSSGSTTTAATVGTIYLANAQIEQASTASSYSPTTTAASGAHRFDYDPVTLAPRGLLVEEQRTNLLLQSNAFTTTWASTLTPTVVQDAVGIDGATSAWTITDDNAAGTEYISQSATLTATAHTLSVFVKKTTGAQSSYPVIAVSTAGPVFGLATIDTTNGTATVWTAVSGGTILSGCSATCQSVSSTFWRVSLTFTATAAVFTTLLIPAATANATQSTGAFATAVTGSAVFTDVSLEAGAFPTSYIPTTTASATRSADSASMTGTNFSSWWNASAGTFVVEGDTVMTASTLSAFISVDDTTANERIQIRGNIASSAYNFNVVDGGVSQSALNLGTYVAGAVVKLSGAYALNDFAASVNGAITVDGSGTMPTPTQMTIGSGISSAALNGHIRRIQYYPTRLPNATLQALTA